MRTNNLETNKRWVKFLNDLKLELSKNDYKLIYPIVDKYNVSSYWSIFLDSNKIVYKNEFGFYKWNNKIPISIKLIEKYRKYMKEINSNSRKNKKQLTLFDKPKVNKTQKVQVEFYDKQKNELGIIRKFFKWLW